RAGGARGGPRRGQPGRGRAGHPARSGGAAGTPGPPVLAEPAGAEAGPPRRCDGGRFPGGAGVRGFDVRGSRGRRESMLHVRRLTKRYGQRIALDGIDLDLAPGETLALLGPSGCGKSTLLRCIQRLVRPDAGDIVFMGQSVLDLEGEALRAYRRKVGFVFQHFNLIPHLTALENVALGPLMAGLSREEAFSRARDALERVGLVHQAAAHPAAMSGGERQRVAIARTLAQRPSLILWDEPTSALDPVLVDEVLAIMAGLAASDETAMIVVTHEIPFALEVADRMALMDQGKIVAEGEPREVLFRSEAPVARRLRKVYEMRYAGLYQQVLSRRGRNGSPRSRSVHRPPERPSALAWI